MEETPRDENKADERYRIVGMLVVHVLAMSPVWIAAYFALMAQVSLAVNREVQVAADNLSVLTAERLTAERIASQHQFTALAESIRELRNEVRALRMQRLAESEDARSGY